jgi:hypothetical protein
VTRPPGGPATRALIGLVVALAAVTALTRACDVVVPDPLRGPVPRVLPVRFDAGVSQ